MSYWQDRLSALKHTSSQRHLSRSYKAQLWEYPNEVQKASSLMAVKGDSMTDFKVAAANEDDEGRLYENPSYLQQHVVYWDDGDVSGSRSMTAELEAYFSAESATYLRKVSAIRLVGFVSS